jgi:PAS domain S-box-containing protein
LHGVGECYILFVINVLDLSLKLQVVTEYEIEVCITYMKKEDDINILMIEEDAEFVKKLSRSLSGVKDFIFSIEYVKTLEEAFLLTQTKNFNIILLDLFLTNSNGLKTLKTVRAKEPNLPIIVLTDNDDVELAVSAVRFGAQDYLIKHNLDTHLLSLAIRYAVERKRTERFQREQLHFLQSVMDNIPSPLYIKDTNLVYGACNAAFEELIGIPKEKIIGKSVFDIFDEEVSEIIRDKEVKLLSGGGTQAYELPFAGDDGEIVEMIFHETVHKRADGSLAGLLGVAMDISEMKNIEKSLKDAKENLENKVDERTCELLAANEKLYKQIYARKGIEKLLCRERKIFVNGPVVVFRCSTSSKVPVEYVSPNITQYGYSSEDFLKNKMKYPDFIHPDYRDKVISDIVSRSKGGANEFEQIFRVNKKNGQVREVYCFINIGRNKKGLPAYFDGYLLDITDWENRWKNHKL